MAEQTPRQIANEVLEVDADLNTDLDWWRSRAQQLAVTMRPDVEPNWEIPVRGRCPMCGERLIANAGWWPARIECTNPLCPKDDAVDVLLDDDEREHIVRIEDERFHVKHPLRERVNDDMLACRVHTELTEMDGPPVPTGVYRVTRVDGELDFQAVKP